MSIQVRATQEGHYGEKYRMAGDEFQIADEGAFSKRWMVKVHGPSKNVEEKVPEKVAEKKKAPKKKAVEKKVADPAE